VIHLALLIVKLLFINQTEREWCFYIYIYSN